MDKDILVGPNISIKDALKKLDATAQKILIVVDKDRKLAGTITDGDIRRCILAGGKLDNSIEGVYNPRPIFVMKSAFEISKVRQLMTEKGIEVMPIINDVGSVIEYISWAEAFGNIDDKPRELGKIEVPVVIMAGGRGTRLEPFTRVLPKPLIPVGEIPMIERIMDGFSLFGVKDFYLILNYKGEMIEAYTKSLSKDYCIHSLWEKEYLGTAGSIKLMSGVSCDDIIVSNCDIQVNANYADVVAFHKQNDSHITLLSSIQHYKIPYGIIEYANGGKVTGIHEKPEYTFVINTGVYILKKECLNYIPDKKKFDMPELINMVLADDRVVSNYPVNQSDFVDIGQWCEYWKEMEKTRFA